MKPTVDKILKDVQQLSKRMRAREETADVLLSKASTVQLQLEAMRQVRFFSFFISFPCHCSSDHPSRNKPASCVFTIPLATGDQAL